MPDLVLDTHIWLWLVEGDGRLPKPYISAIESAAKRGGLVIPSISIWEIGMLAAKGRIVFSEPCQQWVEEAMALPGVRVSELTPEIAIDSCYLPGDFHGDPADRMIVATARVEKALLVTCDDKIRSYGKKGFVNILE